jgi:hypothetical protein
MRNYIFTESEKKVLIKWLSGSLHREDSALLHTTLGRLRRNQSSLIKELRLFILATKRLRLSPKIRTREGDLDTSLAILIPIQIPKTRTLAYMKLAQLLPDAQNIANDSSIDTEHRLDAAKIAAEISMTIIGVKEEKIEKLETALEELKEKLPKKTDKRTSTP